MRLRVLALLALILAVGTAAPLHADLGVGHPFPSLASECTPTIPGIACPQEDALGVGRVEMYSGEYFLEEEDLRIPGRGFDFDMRRTYRSRGDREADEVSGLMYWNWPSSHFGGGWDFSYNIWLESIQSDIGSRCDVSCEPDMDCWPNMTPASALRVHMGNGRTQTFHRFVPSPFTDGLGNGGDFDAAHDTCLNPDPSTGELDVSHTFNAEGNSYQITEVDLDNRTEPTNLGSFTMRFPDGSSWHFATYYRKPMQESNGDFVEPSYFYQDRFAAVCDWIEDANGNRMYLLYAPPEATEVWGNPVLTPQLVAVIDTMGREIDFLYETVWLNPSNHDDGSFQRLNAIRDWTGRTVTYGFEGGAVTTVTTPTVTGTPMLDDATSGLGNDFPEGKVRRTYEYSTESNPRAGRLVAVKDAENREVTRVEYSAGTYDFSPAYVSGHCYDADEHDPCQKETTDYLRVTRHVVGGCGVQENPSASGGS